MKVLNNLLLASVGDKGTLPHTKHPLVGCAYFSPAFGFPSGVGVPPTPLSKARLVAPAGATPGPLFGLGRAFGATYASLIGKKKNRRFFLNQPTLALGLKKKISAIATKIVTQTAFKPTKVVDLCGVGSSSQDLLGFDSRRVAEQVARASQRNQVVDL
jgi:hypothetical protein